MNAENEEHLHRLLAAIRTADRGSASENRSMLLQDRAGVVPFELLRTRVYEDFIQTVGKGCGRKHIDIKPLSEKAQRERRPPPPNALVDAQQDMVNVEGGRFLSASQISRKRRSAPSRGAPTRSSYPSKDIEPEELESCEWTGDCKDDI